MTAQSEEAVLNLPVDRTISLDCAAWFDDEGVAIVVDGRLLGMVYRAQCRRRKGCALYGRLKQDLGNGRFCWNVAIEASILIYLAKKVAL